MRPRSYNIFKIFEPNLTLAGPNVSCPSLGWPIYDETETHGVFPLAMKVDMYGPSTSSVAAAPVVTLYKIADGECGQATLDKKFEAPAIKFAGLQEGRCPDHGYTVAAGRKSLEVPVLGKIEVKLFKKASIVIAPADDSMGTTFHKIVGGQCAEAALDKKLRGMPMQLAGLKPGSCAAQGYTKPAGSQALDLPLVGPVEMQLYQEVSLYRIMDDTCGQVTLGDRKVELSFTQLLTLAELEEGVCTEHGYTMPVGSKPWTLPVIGEVKTELFIQADTTAPPKVGVTLYKISRGKCGEAIIDKQFAGPAQLAGLKEGSCAKHGYVQEAGESDPLYLPVVGKIEIKLFLHSQDELHI